MGGRPDRIDLGSRVRQGEDDSVVRHGRHVVRGEDVPRGHADEHVGVRQAVLEGAVHQARVRGLR